MLEALWQSRKKDMIDLITPFVMYATASLTSPNEVINIHNVQAYVQQHFAYNDIPDSIIRRVFNRNPYSAIKKKNHNYYLSVPIDTEISFMDSRMKECEHHLQILGTKLYEYLNAHCKKSKITGEKHAIDCLHLFFSRYGLQIGTDDLASINFSPNQYEIDYYIARYIFECKDQNNEEYKYLNDLIKGYFLRLAIYIQPENSNLISANYSNITFFYDTPFLIDLLGYSGHEKEKNASILHNMLKKQKGEFRYFPHTKQEITDILYAYKCSLNPSVYSNSYRTLDGLNARNYNSNDVDREISLLSSTLEHNFGIIEQEIPPYEIKKNGAVDEQKVLNENELKNYIRDNTPHYTDDNLENDVISALAIHRLRGDYVSNNIEACRYLFVTNNYDFTNAFNTYYKQNINNKTFQLIISDNILSAITWIKCGEISKLPESELLKNAYCALQPIPEIMKKVDEILQKLNYSGQLTPEQVVTLRADRVFQNEIWSNSFGDINSITEYSIQEARKKYEDKLISIEKDNYQKDLKENAIKQYKQQLERNRLSADSYAKDEKNKWISSRRKIINIIMAIILFLCIIGIVCSFKLHSNLMVKCGTIVATILTGISAIDTITNKKVFIDKILERKANQYETKIREEKLKEYNNLTQNVDMKI